MYSFLPSSTHKSISLGLQHADSAPMLSDDSQYSESAAMSSMGSQQSDSALAPSVTMPSNRHLTSESHGCSQAQSSAASESSTFEGTSAAGDRGQHYLFLVACFCESSISFELCPCTLLFCCAFLRFAMCLPYQNKVLLLHAPFVSLWLGSHTMSAKLGQSILVV